MSTEEKVVPMKRTLADELRAQVTEVAAKASEKDRAAVEKLVKRANGASYSSEVVTLTAPMCALLFLFHNSHNRPWTASWSQELARRMQSGAWKQNSMSAGFYKDGKLEDGQHRLAAAAMSGTTWVVVIVFGAEHGSVDTIDGGRRRTGADHAILDGIIDPVKKQQIVKTAASYFLRSGDQTAALRSEAEVCAAIERNNELLERTMQIGKQSRENVGTPQLKEATASAVAYVMIRAGWPEQTVREKLAFLQQSGGSAIGENDPFFVAAGLLEASRLKAARGEKLSTTKEMAIAIFAITEAEKGTKAVQKRRFTEALKKNLPDPRYPIVATQEAA